MTCRCTVFLTLLPGLAVAQTDPGDLRLSDGFADLRETMVNDPELDLEACAATSASNVTFEVGYLNTQTAFAADVGLKVWFETSTDTDCVGAIPGDGDEMFLGQLTLTPSDDFLDAGTSIRIPEHLEDGDGDDLTSSALTDASILALRSRCPESGGTASDEVLTLCIGLDTSTNGEIESTEPRGWVRFDIDTEAPPKPDTPTVQPLDGRVRITTKVSASGATDDIRKYQGYMRPQPESPDDRGTACEDWGTVSGLRTGSVDVVGGGSAAMEISGTNGVTYEICVYALDDVENLSEASDLATATPRQECDFIECYPDGFLESGCHAAGATPFAGLLVLLLALRRALERRA